MLDAGIKTVGSPKAAAHIEWDKIWSALLVSRVCPDIMPRYRIVHNTDELHDALEWFSNASVAVVIKPEGLTGGKGVKFMGPHLKTYEDCRHYASELLHDKPGEGVLLVERLEGIEFTIMGLTDGAHLILSPSSYDYPYRYADDTGPGTDGMGCFTGPAKVLPFMTHNDLEACKSVMERILKEMRNLGLRFTGVLNGGFFLTRDGIKFMSLTGGLAIRRV